MSVGRKKQTVLHGITLDTFAGEFVAVVGPSGNGKSTLLNLLTGIDHPSRGEVIVNGAPLHKMNAEKMTAWRSDKLVNHQYGC